MKAVSLCNAQTGEIIEATMCRKVLCKAIGLMFSLKKRSLVFAFEVPRRIDLHMFFVFYPIDVFFLDADMRVLEIKRNFMPFSFYYSKNKASYVIEDPLGCLKKTKVGHKLYEDSKNAHK